MTMDIDEALSAHRSSFNAAGDLVLQRNEGDVVASLRQLSIGADVIEQLLSNDRIRSQLSGMSRSDGLEAVQKLGDSITKRRAELGPIENPVGYFLRILSRYKKDGEVVIALKRLGKESIGEDVVDTILSNEKVRAQLSLLSKAEGLEAVEKLGQSLAKRSADLDAIRDIAGYFYKIVSRYDVKNSKKKRRGNDDEQSHYYDNNDNDDDQEDYDDQEFQSELRLAKRRAGTFQAKYQKAERTVAKLEEKLSDLTSELENTKEELDLLKNRI